MDDITLFILEVDKNAWNKSVVGTMEGGALLTMRLYGMFIVGI